MEFAKKNPRDERKHIYIGLTREVFFSSHRIEEKKKKKGLFFHTTSLIEDRNASQYGMMMMMMMTTTTVAAAPKPIDLHPSNEGKVKRELHTGIRSDL